MKVAVTQFYPVFKDVKENLHRSVELVGVAASKGANLVVLPELCTTGYSFMSVQEAEPYSEVLSEPSRPGDLPKSMSVMSALSRKLKVAIAWGFLEKDPGSGSLYNSQALVTPDDRYVSYRKVNQWANDFLWAEEGSSSPPILDYMGKKVGLLICRDVRDKAEGFKDFYEKGDADLVCFSANFGRGAFPSVTWVDFARSNGTWLAVSNRYGKESNNDFGHGGICVVSPEGKVHCDGLAWSQPCIVYAEIP